MSVPELAITFLTHSFPEEVPDQFEVCWNCEANRAGPLPTMSLTTQDPKDQEQRNFLSEKFRRKKCMQLSSFCPIRLINNESGAFQTSRLGTDRK